MQALLLKAGDEKQADLRPTSKDAEREDAGRILACARCRRRVTTTAARIEMSGSHEHTFVNPHGLRFHIGCFAAADSLLPAGPTSTYWSWFPGYSWQVELCAGCVAHLGWLFQGADAAFHGLILDRLVEVEEEP